MSEKTVIECDAVDCCAEREFIGGGFLISDITDAGWVYDPENETHYCVSCKPAVIA